MMLTETRRALARLEYAAGVVAHAAGRPELTGTAGREWYQYPDKEVLQVIAVKAVRIVSGLNASMRLLEDAHTVEVGVLLRTVDDFIDEITFLLEAHQSGSPTKAQKAFVEQFFSEDVHSSVDLLKDRRSADRAKRKDIRAAQGRYLQADNPDRFRRLAQGVDRTLDGYVHGSYPHSMELFDGNTFHMTGTAGSRYPASWQEQIAFYVSRALSVFADVALRLGRKSLFDELRGVRQRFEASSEYPSDQGDAPHL